MTYAGCLTNLLLLAQRSKKLHFGVDTLSIVIVKTRGSVFVNSQKRLRLTSSTGGDDPAVTEPMCVAAGRVSRHELPEYIYILFTHYTY